MANIFNYRGGVVKPDMHTSEKFLLFFLVGENEVPFYQLLKDGLVTRLKDGQDEFMVSYDVAKLFVAQQGFGIQKRWHSFYLKLNSDAPIVQILPYSGVTHKLYFKGKCEMLQRKDILQILPEGSESRKFVERQETLALDTWQKMVTIDKSELRKGVRHVRVGTATKKGGA